MARRSIKTASWLPHFDNDGVRVQALVIARDDFWMEVTHFFKELECEVVEGRNSLAVDQFGLKHAEQVLRLFVRAHGALPESAERESAD